MKRIIAIFCLLVFLVVGNVAFSQEVAVENGKYKVRVEIVYNELDMAKTAELANILADLDKRFGKPCRLEFSVDEISSSHVLYFDQNGTYYWH